VEQVCCPSQASPVYACHVVEGVVVRNFTLKRFKANDVNKTGKTMAGGQQSSICNSHDKKLCENKD